MKGYIERSFFDKLSIYQSKIIGLLLIIVGIVFLYNPTNIHLKVSAGMILMGLFIITIFDINEKSVPKAITGPQLTALILIWIFPVFIISRDIEFDIFLIVIILGIFIIYEFINDYMGYPLKKRMNVLFYLLLIVFILIIGQKVINIVGI